MIWKSFASLAFVIGLCVLLLCIEKETASVSLKYGSQKVFIDYDPRGIPKIRGDSDLAVYFALGYSHAVDRLWQMNILRHLVRGRLSELLGPVTLEADKAMRSFAFKHAADVVLAQLKPDTKAALKAYVDGVNFYAAACTSLPLEFGILNIGFKPWTEKDSMILGLFLSFQISPQWAVTIARTSVLNTVGKKLAEELFTIEDDPIIGDKLYTVLSDVQNLLSKDTHPNTTFESHPQIKANITNNITTVSTVQIPNIDVGGDQNMVFTRLLSLNEKRVHSIK